MKTLWFITNPDSGTTSRAKCEALEAVFDEAGLTLAGRTEFPAQELPKPADLNAAGADTVVLFAGDGTINAALRALAEWGGAFLILPGGTMNLLAKALHDELDPHRIVHAARSADRLVSLPYVEAGTHRAFVGLILGPATAWVRAREAARKGSIGRLATAVRAAWRRTFGEEGIRLLDAPGLDKRYQAIFVRPDPQGLDIAAVDAPDWRSIAQLGWEWVTGEWVAARAVTETFAKRVRVAGKGSVQALFDGEPVMLDAGAPIGGGHSRKAFIATRRQA